MAEFNLIDEPWILCIDLDGNPVEYGIRNTLLKAHELLEICDGSPLVTVAIHRLLLAILYRALNGPTNSADWRNTYSNRFFPQDRIDAYLNNLRPSFDLLSEDRPFYQMGQFVTDKPVSVTRLATESASGNNATLFDHCSDDTDANWTLAQATRYLVACQSFALGFGKSRNAIINGADEVLPYSADAIALRGMTIWLQGDTLFETLMINMSPIKDASLPPWEMKNPNEHRDKLQGKDKKVVTSFGRVDLFTWQSRLVRLLQHGTTISKMYFTQGRSADKSARDPMKVYRFSKLEGVTAVNLSSNKVAWRDAHSILMIPGANSTEYRPECFNMVVSASDSLGVIDKSRSFMTNVAGLATAPNKAGKFLLWRHDRMSVPVALLGNEHMLERLGVLIDNAEIAATQLEKRSWRISKLYLSPDCELPGVPQPDKTDLTKVVKAIDPRTCYWARLETHFYVLLEGLPNDWDDATNTWKNDDQQKSTLLWRENVKREARRALEESIRSLGTTARAIQAAARVRTDFNDNDINPLTQIVQKRKRELKRGKKK